MNKIISTLMFYNNGNINIDRKIDQNVKAYEDET